MAENAEVSLTSEAQEALLRAECDLAEALLDASVAFAKGGGREVVSERDVRVAAYAILQYAKGLC